MSQGTPGTGHPGLLTTPWNSWAKKWTWTTRLLKMWIRYFLAFLHRGKATPLATPEISIENTSVCNSRCVFCPNGIMQRPRQAMKTEVFKRVVDQAVQMGVRDLDFSVMIGDPLLDPHLLERARYIQTACQARDMGFTTTLQWLHLFDLDEFFRCGFSWISVSTTLSGRESYRNFFGVDKYDQMLTNLTALLCENNRRNHQIHVDIGIKPTPEPCDKILNHPDFQLVQSLTTQNLRRTVQRQEFFVIDWDGAVQLPPYLSLFPRSPRAHRPCNRLMRNLMIYSNGKVGACNCVDFEASSELILGNIEETPLQDMWSGSHLAQLRTDWITGTRIPKPCQQCRAYDPKPLPRILLSK